MWIQDDLTDRQLINPIHLNSMNSVEFGEFGEFDGILLTFATRNKVLRPSPWQNQNNRIKIF
jgi:hypothetical protein